MTWLDAEGHIANSRREALVDPDDPRLDAPAELSVLLDPGQSRTFELSFARAQTADTWVTDAEHTRVELVELEVVE